MLVLANVGTTDYARAQLSGKMTSKCSSGGDCITVVCIDNNPCEKFTSNSNNGTELLDFLKNKTKVTLSPQDIVWHPTTSRYFTTIEKMFSCLVSREIECVEVFEQGYPFCISWQCKWVSTSTIWLQVILHLHPLSFSISSCSSYESTNFSWIDRPVANTRFKSLVCW